MSVNAYAALSVGEKLVPFNYDNAKLDHNEVHIKISHCGVCHSDLHLIDNDWNTNFFPVVPGHEIVGIIADKGSNVKHLEIGQRVGVGWQCSSCYECNQCTTGNEQLCSQKLATAIGHYGGFANHVRADSRFAIPIPEQMPSEQAAPLLCGGITVYSPLKNYNITPNMRVAVVGIGGLGHMALKFYNAYGCEVTAISQSEDKREDALEFGAHNFIATKSQELTEYNNYFDFILTTAHVDLNWSALIQALRPKGKLCLVGAANKIEVPAHQLIMEEKSIVGSVTGSPAMIKEMLEFSARQNILAKTELFKLTDVNEALEKVRNNTIKYRAVLDCK